MALIDDLKDRLRLEEGVRVKPYIDTVGIITIGVGRNLKDKGLRLDEVELMLSNDVAEVFQECSKLSFWDNIDDIEKLVLLDMCFNLGFDGLSKFTHFLSSLASGDRQLAAQQMLESKWATQVGQRASRLASLLTQETQV